MLIVPAIGAALAGAATTPAWTTYRHDMQRSGIDPDNTSPVAPTQTWQTGALDGPIYGSPLVYGSRVYVATENDSVYALDAATGAVIWQRHLATAVPASTLPCGTIDPVGVTGTPVIDPATRRIFVVADTWNGHDTTRISHQLFGLDIDTGAVTAGLPRSVDPPGSHPDYQLQRAGLALDAGRILIGYGGNKGDCGEDQGLYHGWIVSVLESGASVRTFEVATDSGGGAVWGSGNGLPVDATGDIWAATGNSPGPPFEDQESVVRLGPELGQPRDQWAPANWQFLDSGDIDLGSSEPVLLPNGLVFAIGKEGVGYLLSASHLGGTGGAPVFQASVCGGSFGGGIENGGVIYVTCSDGIHALSLNPQTQTFAPLDGWNAPSGAIGPPIFAGGRVWSAGWQDGTLYGLDPRTGDASFSTNLGSFDHFATPAAGGGRLFVANDDRVTALRIAATPGTGKPPPVVRPPARPAISGARLTGSGRTRTLRLTLSVPATVTATVTERVPGRRVRGRCRAGARHGSRCTLIVRRARITLRAQRGVNTFRLRFSHLRAGRYTIALSAIDTRRLVSRTVALKLSLSGR